MRRFRCPVCAGDLYFENSACLACGTPVGFDRAAVDLAPVGHRARCVDATLNGCNWLVDSPGARCFACALTRTRPDDHDLVGLPQYHRAEQAKRRLVYELDRLGLTVRIPGPGSSAPPAPGRPALVFDLLSSVHRPVTTGHADGVVTIDLAEGDDAHRTRLRSDLGEAYRTLLGHFRHEVGHYVELLLVRDEDAVQATRALFGDERARYADALERHYADGPPSGWEQRFVSAYATMHPFEDFAETFAHVLHIRDTLETAAAFGMAGGTTAPDAGLDLAAVVSRDWLPLTYALNQLNRSMGLDDFYPFVLAPTVIAKLAHVDRLIRGC